jgi:hypothetical protein
LRRTRLKTFSTTRWAAVAQGKEPEQRRGGRKGARRTDMELTFPDGLTRRPRVRGRSRGLGIVKRDGWPLCPSRLSGADQGLDEGDQLGRERGVRMLLRGQLTTGVQGQATGSFRSPPTSWWEAKRTRSPTSISKKPVTLIVAEWPRRRQRPGLCYQPDQIGPTSRSRSSRRVARRGRPRPAANSDGPWTSGARGCHARRKPPTDRPPSGQARYQVPLRCKCCARGPATASHAQKDSPNKAVLVRTPAGKGARNRQKDPREDGSVAPRRLLTEVQMPWSEPVLTQNSRSRILGLQASKR